MKILAFTQPGTNSYGLFRDIQDGIRDLGHEVMNFEIEPYRAVLIAVSEHCEDAIPPLAQIVLDVIEKNNIDFSISMWGAIAHSLPIYSRSDGSNISLLESHSHPHLHYWWDAPHWHQGGDELKRMGKGILRGQHQFHYINNPGTGSEMAALMGLSNVIPSPNGVNPRIFCPQPQIDAEYDLVFVSGSGDPAPTEVMLQELERDDPDMDRIRKDVAINIRPQLDELVKGFSDSLQQQMRKLLEAMVQMRLDNRHCPALSHLQAAVQADNNLAMAADALMKDLPQYIKATDTIRRIDKWERPFMVAFLSRHFKCLRLGLQSYDAWGIEGDSSGFIAYDKQSEVYAKGKLALNVMRWQDDIGVNSKVFEITACGIACLQSYRGGIEELFDSGKELLVYKTPGEARQLLADALKSPEKTADIARAGRNRTLRDHTWANRMGLVLDVVKEYWKSRGRIIDQPLRIRSTSENTRISSSGNRLAFVLAPMRSGSTLLRKMLDAHGRLVSPPETWFLLPLLDIWNGQAEAKGFNARQAAVALQTVANRTSFVNACSEFAVKLYNEMLEPDSEYLIDKTPMYLRIADQLPAIFPDAKYIILVRDPRAIAWSSHTWEKIQSKGLDSFIPGIANDFKTQYDFARKHVDSCIIVKYENLCNEPEAVCKQICEFLSVSFDNEMLKYGLSAEQFTGYGDEKTLQHNQPHKDSLKRWVGDETTPGMTNQQQSKLADECTADALKFFGYEELAQLLQPTLAGTLE